MFSTLTVILVVTSYMLLLFALAQYVERRIEQNKYNLDKAWVYALSLAVYHTSWTFYGSVGFASRSGWLFLAVYIGAFLSLMCAWFTLRRMIKIKETFHVTSIADFISTRYNHSYLIAALATLIALIGTLPYIALQLTAIVRSYQIITETTSISNQEIWQLPALLITLFMVAFTIIFGARHLDPTERHQGMVAALVAECLVKLFAFLIVGSFVCYWLFDGFSDISNRLDTAGLQPIMDLTFSNQSATLWITLIILSFAGVQLLPRQFHIAVVENANPQHLKTAMWLFPCYMVLINLFVLPIAGAGLLSDINIENADYFVLLLPQQAGEDLITLIAFIGGFSAATGMILITTMTLATMSANHLLLPAIEKVPLLAPLRAHLLQIRWVIVTCILLSSYVFAREISGSYMLVTIGLLSFAAVLQFLPAVAGALFWRRSNSIGAFSGLLIGFSIWIYTLVVPTLIKQGWIDSAIMEQGLWGLNALRPEALFGLTGLPSIAHAVFWSLLANSVAFIIGSLLYQPQRPEQRQAEEFYSAITDNKNSANSRPTELHAYICLTSKKEEAIALLSYYVDITSANTAVNNIISELDVTNHKDITILELLEFHRMVEHQLAGSIGSACAHSAIEQHIRYSSREAQELQVLYSHLLNELSPKKQPTDSPRISKENADLHHELQSKISRLQHQTEQQHQEIDRLEHKLDQTLDKSHLLRIEIQKLSLENNSLRQKLTTYLD